MKTTQEQLKAVNTKIDKVNDKQRAEQEKYNQSLNSIKSEKQAAENTLKSLQQDLSSAKERIENTSEQIRLNTRKYELKSIELSDREKLKEKKTTEKKPIDALYNSLRTRINEANTIHNQRPFIYRQLINFMRLIGATVDPTIELNDKMNKAFTEQITLKNEISDVDVAIRTLNADLGYLNDLVEEASALPKDTSVIETKIQKQTDLIKGIDKQLEKVKKNYDVGVEKFENELAPLIEKKLALSEQLEEQKNTASIEDKKQRAEASRLEVQKEKAMDKINLKIDGLRAIAQKLDDDYNQIPKELQPGHQRDFDEINALSSIMSELTSSLGEERIPSDTLIQSNLDIIKKKTITNKVNAIVKALTSSDLGVSYDETLSNESFGSIDSSVSSGTTVSSSSIKSNQSKDSIIDRVSNAASSVLFGTKKANNLTADNLESQVVTRPRKSSTASDVSGVTSVSSNSSVATEESTSNKSLADAPTVSSRSSVSPDLSIKSKSSESSHRTRFFDMKKSIFDTTDRPNVTDAKELITTYIEDCKINLSKWLQIGQDTPEKPHKVSIRNLKTELSVLKLIMDELNLPSNINAEELELPLKTVEHLADDKTARIEQYLALSRSFNKRENPIHVCVEVLVKNTVSTAPSFKR